MEAPGPARRTVLKGGAALAGLSVIEVAGPSPVLAGETADGEVLPWLDQPPPVPAGAADVFLNRPRWEDLDTWRTPVEDFFRVQHYGLPDQRAAQRPLAVDGLVERPQSLSAAQLRGLPQHEVDFTLECSGDDGFPFLVGAIGNARWGGASLRAVLDRARPRPGATEVVFWGADRGTVTISDDSGITGGGSTGTVVPDATGGLDLTITERFARSMSLEDARDPRNLLCTSMNGAPLPREHGGPLRLIAPGWYGVANVKWLTRVELRAGRFAGRFMARDYVTIREEQVGGEAVWTFTTVGRVRLKSAPARVVSHGGRLTVRGAAWGAPVARVEVRVNDGPWQPAELDGAGTGSGVAWRFWTFDWGRPAAGRYHISSRAVAQDGRVQPSPADPSVAGRVTFWENNGWLGRSVLVP